ncbi:hypothetical protein [Microbacterium terricola]|uniref:Uncharacterized protein n=1 Tax=Microbacterium terricola TaxID=344163 RepID=A0ABM8DX63_9MICO|nr:hypothetical protein [Microbacterium terricola]UYK39076.1 hypothetical protein OAU46_10220 [Microbacterium terricola]BDV30214.1 hypothetical protein Microterr_08740 [Microbacterium terricola]
MAIDPQTLLTGPRGRRLCLEYLVASAREAGTPEGEAAATAIFWAAHQLDPNPGTLMRIGDDDGSFVEPVVSATDVAEALAGVEPAEPTAGSLREALAASADSARYWQEPDGEDALAASAELRPALDGVASAIAASPHAAWWDSPVDPEDQWSVPWDGDATLPSGRDAVLRTWREATVAEEIRAERERSADPTENWTGEWWSMPPAWFVHTTRSLGEAGPAGLWFVEDGTGWETAVATPVDAVPARVIEIDGPDAWIELCRRHPLVVTASRRHDWYRATGRAGEWVVPDWSKVAEEADAVHLSVQGYLSTAGRAIDIGEGKASVLAGWSPDATYWFAGTSARPADARSWQLVDDRWVPAVVDE